MSNFNILVTGGAGFIGSHLVDALVERGHRVRILDSIVEQVHGGDVPEHLNKEAEFIRGDVCDADVVAKSLEGIDVVYHEAAEVGVGQSMYEIVRYVKANDLGTAVLLEEMLKRKSQFKKLVVASSMSIYGEGAYFCSGCNKTINPFLRSEQRKKSRYFRRRYMRSASRTRNNTAWQSAELTRSRPSLSATLMFMARVKRCRTRTLASARYSRRA